MLFSTLEIKKNIVRFSCCYFFSTQICSLYAFFLLFPSIDCQLDVWQCSNFFDFFHTTRFEEVLFSKTDRPPSRTRIQRIEQRFGFANNRNRFKILIKKNQVFSRRDETNKIFRLNWLNFGNWKKNFLFDASVNTKLNTGHVSHVRLLSNVVQTKTEFLLFSAKLKISLYVRARTRQANKCFDIYRLFDIKANEEK